MAYTVCIIIGATIAVVVIGAGLVAGCLIAILKYEARKALAIDDAHEGTHLYTFKKGDRPWWQRKKCTQ